MQFDPSPVTQEYCHQSPCSVPPAQWGNRFARESGEEDECELFGDMPAGKEEPFQDKSAQSEAHQHELDRAAAPSHSNANASNLAGPRCINGELARPTPPRDYSPSTACQASTVCASKGVRLGKANPPCFGAPPGINQVPSRRLQPPPPPPPSGNSSSLAANPVSYPMPWTPLNTRPKCSGGGPPDGSGGGSNRSGAGDPTNPSSNAHLGGGGAGSNSSGGGVPSGGGPPNCNPGSGSAPPPPPPPGSTPPQSTAGAGQPGGNPNPACTPPTTPPGHRAVDPWASLDWSRKPLPKLSLPSNYKSCSTRYAADARSLEAHVNVCLATWRGDVHRYWLTEVLDPARARYEQWLQSPPAQRATLEPAYILGDRKHITEYTEAPSAVESVLHTELLEVISKSLAEACMRHGYCDPELIVWYIMKQLILPPDVNEVTMQKEILTPPKYLQPPLIKHLHG